MIYSKTQSNKNKKTSGFSIVMVIVAMAFVGVLVAVIMLASLYNFYTKATNRKAKDNFYTAETALEEIRAGLQIEVDKAFNVAYMSVFQDYTTNLSEKNSRFGKAYRTTLVNSLQSATADASGEKQYDLPKIQGYVTRPLNANVGAEVTGIGGSIKNYDDGRHTLVEYTDGVRLEGVQITYYDEQGYVSIISTNILLKVPELDLINPVIVPPLEDYALIANKQLQVNHNTTLAGGAYGGMNGITVNPSMDFTIKRAEFQSIDVQKTHNVYVTTDSDIDIGYTGELTGRANLTIEPGIEVWANGINTFGGKLTMRKNANYASSIYLQDDLTLRRSGNNVDLSGRFYGFGSIVNDPGNSSAIVINGTNTTLDLSGLDTLKVAGNAYIATKKANDNVTLTEEDLKAEEEEEIEEPEPEIIRNEKSETIKHNQTSPSPITKSYFAFSGNGTWTAGDSYHTWSNPITNLNNASATYYEVKFTGHKIDIYSGKNKMMGKVKYSIDGEEKYIADLYNNGNQNSVFITTISGLEEGEHTFRAEAIAERNSANPLSNGDLRIDAAQVVVYYYEIIEPVKPEKPDKPQEPKPPTITVDEAMSELKGNKDVRTGSSISSKAEQMAYLVPPQYVGWIDGKCVIGTNPVSEDVYRRFKAGIGSFAGGSNYNEVNLSADLALSNYGASYEKVFVRTTGGQTWVYYYLKFVNAAWADRFFEDYFRDNKGKLDSYMKSYITSIKLNPALEASDSLNFYLAGNMITGNASNYKLVPYTSTNLEENSQVYEEFAEYENQFGALNKILRKSYKEMTPTQSSNSVYANVVDTVAMGKLLTNRLEFFEDEDSTKPIALIKKGDYTWLGTGNDSDLHMIICDGNVSVKANFEGLIIASGIISIDSAVTVSAYGLLNTAMMAETHELSAFLNDEIGGSVIQHMPLYFLVDGQEKEIKEDKDISDETYTAADFVIYENWSKQ